MEEKGGQIYSKVGVVITLDDLIKSLPFFGLVGGAKRKLTSTIGIILKRLVGSELLIPFPPSFSEIGIESFDLISIANFLREKGFLGKIHVTSTYPDEPFLFRTKTSQGGGADFLSMRSCLWKTVAESVERFIWRNSDTFYKKLIKIASPKQLGSSALNLSKLVGFSEEQRTKNKELKYTEETVFGWVKASSFINGGKYYIPIQLASLRYFKEHVPKDEPMLRWCITTGLATGKTLENALLSGLLEVIERDAFMVTYLNLISPSQIDLIHLSKKDHDFRRIFKNFSRYNLEVKIVRLITDMPVKVYAATIIDQSKKGPAIAFGAKAGFDEKDVILGALSEALSTRLWVKKHLGQKVDKNKLNRDERVIFWAQSENLEKLNFLFGGPIERVEIKNRLFKTDNSNLTKERLLKIKQALAEKQYEAFFIEISPREVRAAGLRSIVAIIPMMQPMHLDETIPYFSGVRLSEVPAKLGYKSAVKLNAEPHPFP